MKTTRLDGVYTWSRFQERRGIDFNGFCVTSPAGRNVLIDPMPIGEGERDKIRDVGGADYVLVTNADHLRSAPLLAESFDAEILAPQAERERFGPEAEHIDRWFVGGDDLPPALSGLFEILPVRGGKSEVEIALHLPHVGAILFSDVVRSHVSGELCLLPDDKLTDRDAVLADLRALADRAFDAVLLGDGDSLWRGGRAAFDELLSRPA